MNYYDVRINHTDDGYEMFLTDRHPADGHLIQISGMKIPEFIAERLGYDWKKGGEQIIQERPND